MAKFLRRPCIVEAAVWTGENGRKIKSIANGTEYEIVIQKYSDDDGSRNAYLLDPYGREIACVGNSSRKWFVRDGKLVFIMNDEDFDSRYMSAGKGK